MRYTALLFISNKCATVRKSKEGFSSTMTLIGLTSFSCSFDLPLVGRHTSYIERVRAIGTIRPTLRLRRLGVEGPVGFRNRGLALSDFHDHRSLPFGRPAFDVVIHQKAHKYLTSKKKTALNFTCSRW